MIIKVCGMREPENIRAVAALDIDLMGFIFYPSSSRFVQMISSRAGIIPDYSEERLIKAKHVGKKQENDASEAVGEQFAGPKRVGVFVDDMPQNIVTRVYNFKLDYVQLHGNESPVMIDNLRRTLADIRPVKVLKTIKVDGKEDFAKCKEYEGMVDYFLFHNKCQQGGGSGEQFDWNILDAYDGNVPFLISGGIGIDDVERIKAISHPQFMGVDINSKFEIAPGLKDVEAVRLFMEKIRG